MERRRYYYDGILKICKFPCKNKLITYNAQKVNDSSLLCFFYREPDEWVLESEVQSTKHVGIRKAVASNPEQVSLALYPAISSCTPSTARAKQRRKPVKNS